ncbi:MAG: lytic murein transglycosylase B [Acidiferrobacterales bacterium]
MQTEKSLNHKELIHEFRSTFHNFRFIPRISFLIFFLLTPASLSLALDWREYPAVRDFIDYMVDKHNFSPDELHYIFRRAEIREKVIAGMDSPREAVPWHIYRQQFVTVFGARRGAKFWNKYSRSVDSAADQYGVAPEIIVAIIGVESQYGHNTGRFRVIDSLSSLAFDYPRRSKVFKKELEEFLLLARELGVSPLSIKGSYAGAMGYPQFLPSSYRDYAVDFNNDGHIDLLSTAEDAIGSVGNYFKVHGWEKDEPVVDLISTSGPVEPWLLTLDIKPRLTIANLAYYNIKPMKYDAPGRKAALIKLEGKNGKILRLGFNNFYVITRYNKSVNYAMAVFELSQMIKNQQQRTNKIK